VIKIWCKKISNKNWGNKFREVEERKSTKRKRKGGSAIRYVFGHG
jgi:hypothetical protein